MTKTKDKDVDPRSTYDPDKANRIIKRIAKGSFQAHACALERVPNTTFEHWMDQHPDMGIRVHEAKAGYIENELRELKEIAREKPNVYINHSQWRLERMQPLILGNRQKVDVKGGGVVFKIEHPDWAKPLENKDNKCQSLDEGGQADKNNVIPIDKDGGVGSSTQGGGGSL